MITAAQRVSSAKSGSSGTAVQQSAGKGFVQSIVTYTVMDNLTVSPVSAISAGITLLNTVAVKDLGDIQEKTVQLGYKEVDRSKLFHLFFLTICCTDSEMCILLQGLAILKASLESQTVLTDVFLGNNKSRRRRR
jgi:hypothetical protein